MRFDTYLSKICRGTICTPHEICDEIKEHRRQGSPFPGRLMTETYFDEVDLCRLYDTKKAWADPRCTHWASGLACKCTSESRPR